MKLAELSDFLGIDTSSDSGKFTFSKGFYTIRKEYYWTPKRTPEESFKSTLEKLQEKYIVSDVEYGDKYQSFKGGEGVKKNSHYWMRFKLNAGNS